MEVYRLLVLSFFKNYDFSILPKKIIIVITIKYMKFTFFFH